MYLDGKNAYTHTNKQKLVLVKLLTDNNNKIIIKRGEKTQTVFSLREC